MYCGCESRVATCRLMSVTSCGVAASSGVAANAADRERIALKMHARTRALAIVILASPSVNALTPALRAWLVICWGFANPCHHSGTQEPIHIYDAAVAELQRCRQVRPAG